jgi:hypothetical protein
LAGTLVFLTLPGCSDPAAHRPAAEKTQGTEDDAKKGGGQIVLGAPIIQGKDAAEWIKTL